MEKLGKDDIIRYENGAIRQSNEGRGLYQYISTVGLRRLAARYEYGAIKYGASDNYKQGLPTGNCIDSIFRHLIAYLEGEKSEDHMAAVAWNAFCIMETEANHPEMQTIPKQKGE